MNSGWLLDEVLSFGSRVTVALSQMLHVALIRVPFGSRVTVALWRMGSERHPNQCDRRRVTVALWRMVPVALIRVPSGSRVTVALWLLEEFLDDLDGVRMT